MTALAALNLARSAWAAKQPQMVLSGWAAMLDELDEARMPAGLVEPAGLTTGAEPHCAPPEAIVSRAVPPATPYAGGSAPLPTDGRCANANRDARSGQKGA